MAASSLPSISHPPKGADVTRERLLQATHELLFERAGVEPSVSQICERAGVQVAMVSYCFGGKTRMLEALVQRLLDNATGELDQLAAQQLEPVETLHRHIAAVIRNFVRYPYLSQLTEQLRTGSSLAAHMAGTLSEPMIAFYTDLLAAGVRDRVFREIDPTLLFFSVVGMCEYLFAARSSLSDAGAALDNELIERFTEHTLKLLMHGMLA